MIKNKKNVLLIVGIICLIISSICLVSYSNTDIQEVIIKSMTPIYDEESTVLVDNLNVTFNDKDQVVKYNIVVENTQDYDVKVSELQFGTQSEEFLKYTVENINVDDVIKAGESKELVVSFETVKMDGWGRNFNDELVTTLVFDEVKIQEEVVVPPVEEPKQEEVVVPPVVDTKPNTNEPTNKVENNTSNNVQPEVNEPVVNEPVVEQSKEEVKDEVTTPEDDVNHELGMNQEIIVKDTHPEYVFVGFCFGIATGVLGIGLVMVNKNKFTKYIVLFVIVGSSVKLAQADEIMSLEIPINVSYESQNVMMASGCIDIAGMACDTELWGYNYKIKNFYIENEFNDIENYAYKFDVSEEQNGKVVAYLVVNENSCYGECYDVHLQAEGIIYPNEDMSYYFSGMDNLDEIINFDGFDTSNVTDMSNMFAYTGNVIFDMSGFDTSNVTDMKGLFSGIGCDSGSLVLDLSNFDTSKVTDMGWMFSSTGNGCDSFTLDVSSFDTSNVTNMSGMFSGAGGYSAFNLDLSNFDTSNVTNMSRMFSAGIYKNEFTVDLSNFDTSKVTDMSGMFSSRLISELDLSGFDTSNVTNMSSMFSFIGSYSSSLILDLSNFNTRNVNDMSSMFYGAGRNSTMFVLDLSSFDTSNVTNMTSMFRETGYNSSNFVLDVSNFDTSKVTNMTTMFYQTGNVSDVLKTSITIKNPNISKYSSMFEGVATRSGSQITVNYTNKTSDLVDKMIATKSSNSNVVKGELVD